MCNILDGPCKEAGKYPGNKYHDNPTLHYQIRGELIQLFSDGKKLSEDDPEYGYRMGALRKTTADRIIKICKLELEK